LNERPSFELTSRKGEDHVSFAYTDEGSTSFQNDKEYLSMKDLTSRYPESKNIDHENPKV